LRAGGLRSLTPSHFYLDDGQPRLVLPVRHDKSRRGKEQPIPADVTTLLRSFLQGKPAHAPLWSGTWHLSAAEMLRRDLEAAGIPYEVQGHDGPLYADFHALGTPISPSADAPASTRSRFRDSPGMRRSRQRNATSTATAMTWPMPWRSYPDLLQAVLQEPVTFQERPWEQVRALRVINPGVLIVASR
jgi:hypothetical protein